MTNNSDHESVNSEPFFDDKSGTPTKVDSNLSLSDHPELWEARRDSHIFPRVVSDLGRSEAGRSEFLAGARLLGLDTPKKPLHPQQLILADACNALDAFGRPLNQYMGVLIPRRSSKTTSILAVALGRCTMREDYRVGFTLATTGAKARERFILDIVAPLKRMYPDKDTRPFIIRESQGSERITWPNGSVFSVLTPTGEAFRSDAFDMIIIDEAGEASPELGEDLLAGALATTDTRPDAQFIIAGTAAQYREGNLLWDVLEDGREGIPGTGIVEYSAPEPVTVDDLEDWSIVEALVLECHPGIDTLTTLPTIKERHRKLKPHNFLREYLSVFGRVGAAPGIVDMEKWEALGSDANLPRLPERFALGIAAHPDQVSASIVAAWRSRGKARLMLLKRKDGVQWLANEATALSAKYSTGIAHDTRGVVTVEVEVMQRKRPRPKLLPQTTKNVTTAAALLIKEIDDLNLEHFNQPELTEAAKLAKKRRILGSWGLGRGDDTDDITPLEAAAMALRVYDAMPVRQPLPRMTL